MENRATKIMSIKAKCGAAEKELSFPVPAELMEWISSIKRPGEGGSGDDAMQFTVEGHKKMQIQISLYDLRRKF